MELIPPDTNIDFLGRRRIAFTVSGALILLSLVSVFAWKGIRLGIDFTGGIELQVRFREEVPIDRIRSVLGQAGFEAMVQSLGKPEEHEFLVRLGQPEDGDAKGAATRLQHTLEKAFADVGIEVRRVEVVGPQVGSELRRKGLLSILFALVGILVYVAFRFELRYALGAIAALVHDVTIVVGFFSLTDHEFNLPTIAALLTIIGYSLNDTIVIFDRIRETVRRQRKGELVVLMNRAINETLSRTLLTSLTTMITVWALLILTPVGSVIHDFALALFAGVVVGTYSSIFVASPIVLVGRGRK